MKYSGIIIDNKLWFTKHVATYAKEYTKNGVLRRVETNISIETITTMHNTIVQTHFTFASTVLYGEIEILQVFQNRAMRMILGCDLYLYQNKLHGKYIRVAECETLHGCIEYQAMMFIHKTELDLMPQYLNRCLFKFTDRHQYLGTFQYKIGRNSVFHKRVSIII